MDRRARFAGRMALSALGYGLVTALVLVPIALERAIESVRFEDRLGSVPVEISLAHNGYSSLDTGVLGVLYWEKTGVAGFGATVRAVGPPEAGGTLSSYASPRFLKANAQFVSQPEEVARAYGAEVRARMWRSFLLYEVVGGTLGGLLLTAITRGRNPINRLSGARRVRWGIGLGVVGVVLAGSSMVALWLFQAWEGSQEVTRRYPMPGMEQLSFSSPQTLEVARQIRPFLEKNSRRTQERAEAYELAAEQSLSIALPAQVTELTPREGEVIVLAEADPQGSYVGTRVRHVLYPILLDLLGEDVPVMRTISGDITSNGTLIEEDFVEEESQVSGRVPTVAVKGDHDSENTMEQLADNDVLVPHLEPIEVGGLTVVAANDPAFKQLFGGLVTNDSGLTETEVGTMLRERVADDEPTIVLLHQHSSALGYLGVQSRDTLRLAEGRETVPWDDGISDAPPGAVNFGHLHDVDGPWVIWNTDGDEVTWTVVNQLGTSGGVVESPTINRFSTPDSAPLKPISLQLHFFNAEAGLQTGYVRIDISTDGDAVVGDRVDLGLPGGQPLPTSSLNLRP